MQMFVYFCGMSGCCTEIDSSHQPITITISILQDLQLTIFLRGTAKMTRHLAASTEAQRCLPRAPKHLKNLENEDKQENTQLGRTRRHVGARQVTAECGGQAPTWCTYFSLGACMRRTRHRRCARQYHDEKLVEGYCRSSCLCALLFFFLRR